MRKTDLTWQHKITIAADTNKKSGIKKIIIRERDDERGG